MSRHDTEITAALRAALAPTTGAASEGERT